MANQILSNLKMYIEERKKHVMDRCECTESEYSLGKLDFIDEISNFITGEAMHFSTDGKDLYEV